MACILSGTTGCKGFELLLLHVMPDSRLQYLNRFLQVALGRHAWLTLFGKGPPKWFCRDRLTAIVLDSSHQGSETRRNGASPLGGLPDENAVGLVGVADPQHGPAGYAAAAEDDKVRSTRIRITC